MELTISDVWEEAGHPWTAVLWIYVVDEDEMVLEFDVDAAMLRLPIVHAAAQLLPRLLAHIASEPEARVASANSVLQPDLSHTPRIARAGSSWAKLARLDAILAAGAAGAQSCFEARTSSSTSS